MIYSLEGTASNVGFPNPEEAEAEPDGLLAVGGDLSPERLLNAYRQGIFPWYSEGQPILWWSPNPRTLLYPNDIHISRSLRRDIRHSHYHLKLDHAFNAVLEACAAPRSAQDGTWLLPEMRDAYAEMHRLGHAHSIELWQEERLVGGLYGIAIGRAFFGESMFSRVPSASRIVMVYLCQLLQSHEMNFLDCQVFNPHLASMGAIEIPRQQFLGELLVATQAQSPRGLWQSPEVQSQDLLLPGNMT